MNFDGKVWGKCKLIPKGEVSTYKEIAKALGSKAYRAVGVALRRNPYVPKVPCHRVVNSDGNVGFYKGIKNSKEKIKLLKKEGVEIRDNKIDLKKYLFRF